MQLQEHRTELEATGAAVAAVTFELPAFAEMYVEETGWPWPFLVDTDRRAYEAFGMTRGSRLKVFGPNLWWGYIKLLLQGRDKVRKPHGDLYQLGGDVIVDAHGCISYLHCSETPLDRPTVEELVEALRRNGR